MGGLLLKDWADIWTQGIGDNMAETMWGQLRQLIVESRRSEDPMDEITEEDVIKEYKNGVKQHGCRPRSMVSVSVEKTEP